MNTNILAGLTYVALARTCTDKEPYFRAICYVASVLFMLAGIAESINGA